MLDRDKQLWAYVEDVFDAFQAHVVQRWQVASIEERVAPFTIWMMFLWEEFIDIYSMGVINGEPATDEDLERLVTHYCAMRHPQVGS